MEYHIPEEFIKTLGDAAIQDGKESIIALKRLKRHLKRALDIFTVLVSSEDQKKREICVSALQDLEIKNLDQESLLMILEGVRYARVIYPSAEMEQLFEKYYSGLFKK